MPVHEYDVIVVGGGIAGVYASLCCCEKGMKVLTIERDSRWGGRIRTIKRDGEVYEAGAARFHKGHKRMMALLKRFNIETVALDKSLREFRSVRCGKKKMESPAYNLIQLIVEGAKGRSAGFLRSLTFGDFAEMVIGPAGRVVAQAAFGYDGEFDVINAYDGVRMFKHDFTHAEEYYICKNGLSSVVDAMVLELEEKHNWNKMLEHRVMAIERVQEGFSVTFEDIQGKRERHIGKKLILAVPKRALLELGEQNGLWSQEQLAAIQSVDSVPCTRIYARYEKPWFQGLPITTTDIPIRQFIPISERLAMVSYSDSKEATGWSATTEQGTDRLTKRIHQGLKALFPEKRIPMKPEWIEAYHWRDAIHMWRPGVQSSKTSEQMTAGKWGGEGLYVCGEAYSTRQCWAEGALQTVEDMMEHMKGMASRGGSDWIQWVKKNRNGKGELPRSKLKELKKAYPDALWVLFQDRLINLTAWYYNHPGGQTPFDNHMHKDVYPFFKKILNHYQDGKMKKDVVDKIKELTIAWLI